MKRFGVVLLLVFCALSPISLRAQGRGEILRAEYGAGERWTDVTQRVRSLFRGGDLNFRVDNDTLGADPAHGTPKILRLMVRDGNRIRQMEFRENQNVNLRGYNPDNNYNGFRILGAQYGAGNRMIDVTDRLNSQVQGGRLSLQVMNETMGGDPANGLRKSLTVWYTFNGQRAQTVVNENDYLNLPGGGFAGDNRDRRDDRDNRDDRFNGRGLQITRAHYGAGTRLMDVTDLLNSQIRGGQLSMQVINETMGGDPVENQRKALTVWYTFNGRAAQTVVNENGYLNLPTRADTAYRGDNRDNRNNRDNRDRR